MSDPIASKSMRLCNLIDGNPKLSIKLLTGSTPPTTSRIRFVAVLSLKTIIKVATSLIVGRRPDSKTFNIPEPPRCWRTSISMRSDKSTLFIITWLYRATKMGSLITLAVGKSSFELKETFSSPFRFHASTPRTPEHLSAILATSESSTVSNSSLPHLACIGH